MNRKGWIVTVAGVGLNLALGILYAWSVFSKQLAEDVAKGGFGWTKTQATLPYTVAIACFALMMVPAGRLQDKIGPRLVGRLLSQHPALEGLYHVAAEPIDKHELLTRLARELGRDDLTIAPVDEPFCDRSLDGSAFAAATGYRAPSWDEMLRELAQEIRARRDERP